MSETTNTKRDHSRVPVPLLEDIGGQQLQLRALLAMTLDERAGFRMQSQETRDGFLLACSVMGAEVLQLVEMLHVRLGAEHIKTPASQMRAF